MTNSAFYGISNTITGVKQAIVILRLDAIKSVVISASVFDAFSANGGLDRGFIQDAEVAFAEGLHYRSETFIRMAQGIG